MLIFAPKRGTTVKIILFLLALSSFPPMLLAQSESSVILRVDPSVQKLQRRYLQQQKSDPGMAGYRVQIYNGRKKECQDVRARFLQFYPSVPAYLRYESPEYRVQVGDFRTALEAERFLRKMNQNFRGCFLLKTRVSLPPLQPEESD